MAVQRSITTDSPASAAIGGRLPVHDPELEPETRGARLDGFLRVRHAQLRAAEHIDHVEAARCIDRRGERLECGDPEDLLFVRVHGHAVETVVEEEPEYSERRSRGVGRGADHGDPTGRSQDDLDAGVVEDVDRAASFLQVEERPRPGHRHRVLAARQEAPSLT